MRPDAALVVDANMDASHCILGHPSVVNFEKRIEGAFGSAQWHDIVHNANPIELMGIFTKELRRLELEVRERLKALGSDARWPPAIVAATGIQSRGWISNIPDGCIMSPTATFFLLSL